MVRNREEEYEAQSYILDWLEEINVMYNNPNMYDDLQRSLEELIKEVREDIITYG